MLDQPVESLIRLDTSRQGAKTAKNEAYLCGLGALAREKESETKDLWVMASSINSGTSPGLRFPALPALLKP
jgi:hypothetical protein